MSKFYDGSELLSRSKYKIFFSLGGRNIGKSTDFQKRAIRGFIKKRRKFGIIVKFQDDVEDFAANYFSDKWMNTWYPDFEIMFKGGKCRTYYMRKKSDKTNKDDKKSGWKECGYAFILNKSSTYKSTTKYQDVSFLLYEEFMPLNNRYIKKAKEPELEAKLLIELYQTIARGDKNKHTRKVTLICISNNYTLNNQYFTHFHILNMITKNPNSVYQRFYTYDDDKLHYALEFSQIQPELTGIETDEEALGIQFKDFRNQLKLTKDRPKKIIMQLTFNNEYIINIASYNDSLICYEGDKDVICDLCYTCSPFKFKDRLGIKIFKGSDKYRILCKMFERNDLYYDKLETFINLTNILAF